MIRIKRFNKLKSETEEQYDERITEFTKMFSSGDGIITLSYKDDYSLALVYDDNGGVIK